MTVNNKQHTEKNTAATQKKKKKEEKQYIYTYSSRSMTLTKISKKNLATQRQIQIFKSIISC